MIRFHEVATLASDRIAKNRGARGGYPLDRAAGGASRT